MKTLRRTHFFLADSNDSKAVQLQPLLNKISIKKAMQVILFLALQFGVAGKVFAQDPTLPPTNLGLANVFDGIAGKPGFVYQGYAQVFQTQKITGDESQDLHSGLKVNSLLQMNQFIYLSPVKVIGGNLGFTVLIPVVQINASNTSGPTPSVNPGVLGDIVQGTAIQWSNKKLFGKPFSHRVEFDVNLPTGSYNANYNINASTHAYAFGIYHAFTLLLSDQISISSRNQFNYNDHFIGQKDKAGAYYNGNYSIDYAIHPNLRIEAASYFLTQINQDSYNGNSNYYLQQYGIANTKERVFGYGPGLAYFTRGGTLLEVKTFFEAWARNRAEGYRPTLRIAIPLN
jgi:hypothetical protein